MEQQLVKYVPIIFTSEPECQRRRNNANASRNGKYLPFKFKLTAKD